MDPITASVLLMLHAASVFMLLVIVHAVKWGVEERRMRGALTLLALIGGAPLLAFLIVGAMVAIPAVIAVNAIKDILDK